MQFWKEGQVEFLGRINGIPRISTQFIASLHTGSISKDTSIVIDGNHITFLPLHLL